jgi:hypothetical protein
MTPRAGIVQYGGASPVMRRLFLRLRVSLQFGFMPLGGMSTGACVVLGVLRFTSIFTQEVFEWELWAFINEGRGRFSRPLPPLHRSNYLACVGGRPGGEATQVDQCNRSAPVRREHLRPSRAAGAPESEPLRR